MLGQFREARNIQWKSGCVVPKTSLLDYVMNCKHVSLRNRRGAKAPFSLSLGALIITFWMIVSVMTSLGSRPSWLTKILPRLSNTAVARTISCAFVA